MEEISSYDRAIVKIMEYSDVITCFTFGRQPESRLTSKYPLLLWQKWYETSYHW